MSLYGNYLPVLREQRRDILRGEVSIHTWQARRGRADSSYAELLAGLDLVAPFVRPDVEYVYHQYTIRLTHRGELVIFRSTMHQ